MDDMLGEMDATWQEEAIERLRGALEADGDVLAFVVFGSAAEAGLADEWSDLDAFIVVRDEALARYFPETVWLRAAGEFFFALQREQRDYGGLHRVCYAGLRRVDMVVIADSALASVDGWRRNPFRLSARRTVFSRSPAVDALLARPREALLPAKSADDFGERCDGFSYDAVMAVYKVARGDLLIATHLALGLAQECCELAMMLRDRATGTTVHRTGDAASNALALRVGADPRASDAGGVLDLVERCVALFDELAAQWDASYAPRAGALAGMIARARENLTP